MNKCFLIGTIISDIKFSFTLNKKIVSMTIFYIKLLNQSIIKVYAFDDNADYCYRKLEKDMSVFIEGKIISFDNELVVAVENINAFNKEYKYLKGEKNCE